VLLRDTPPRRSSKACGRIHDTIIHQLAGDEFELAQDLGHRGLELLAVEVALPLWVLFDLGLDVFDDGLVERCLTGIDLAGWDLAGIWWWWAALWRRWRWWASSGAGTAWVGAGRMRTRGEGACAGWRAGVCSRSAMVVVVRALTLGSRVGSWWSRLVVSVIWRWCFLDLIIVGARARIPIVFRCTGSFPGWCWWGIVISTRTTNRGRRWWWVAVAWISWWRWRRRR
jgi:hypothetical protein